MNEKRGRWVPLHVIFRKYEDNAAQWMSDRDERLRTSTDVETDDRRRRSQPETESRGRPMSLPQLVLVPRRVRPTTHNTIKARLMMTPAQFSSVADQIPSAARMSRATINTHFGIPSTQTTSLLGSVPRKVPR